jgi:hypothetical protein
MANKHVDTFVESLTFIFLIEGTTWNNIENDHHNPYIGPIL